MKKIILLDPGHGNNTEGKRSQIYDDGSQIFEWEFNRDIVRRIQSDLRVFNVECINIVPEDSDIPLAERVRRANEYGSDAIYISVHANAGGGTGFEVFTSVGRSKSNLYAEIISEEFDKEFPEQRNRGTKEHNYYVLRNTKMPAILTESFFMDTFNDSRILLSEAGRKKIAQFHVSAIMRMMTV
ncbi:N-acetylmuramoyl-L-alanine amidase [Arsukibacterium perlucidum]|uniref:N-acetylmuramoyl-L-alanine amidase n=1 Tax=Arsukibacterium perlucidum TaxID=368811 RepID=UPI0005267567|nr:N-acetylmuramoyl-L-alanine amidase [Arsukibacterium perlucidum]